MLDQTSQTAGGTKAARALPSIAFGIERLGLIAMRTPITSLVILLVLCVARILRPRAHQDRQLAEPAVPLEHQGIPPVRGGHQALPGDRIRRAGRGRGQVAACARVAGEDPRSCHRHSACRRNARNHLAFFRPPGARAGQASGGAVPGKAARGGGLRQIHRDGQNQRDPARQAAVRRRHARADRAGARSGSRLQQAARAGGRRDPQTALRHGAGHRPDRPVVRRADHAARDPQRGGARRHHLQRRRRAGRAA